MDLYPYQRETVTRSIKHSYNIIALEMGLGKTFCALTVGVETKSKMLIVCPAYLRLNWSNEIKKFYPHLKSKICTLSKHVKDYEELDAVIISYDFLKNAEVLFEWCGLVIADECTALKTMSSIRTKLFHKLIYENSVERLLLLSGTPILGKVFEFYSLIALCNYNPKLKGLNKFLSDFPNYVSFADRFSHRKEFEMMVRNRRIKIVGWEGYKNVEELKLYLKDIYIRFKAKDVLKDLPSRIYKDILIKDSEDLALLEEFENAQAMDDMDKIRPKVKAQAALSKASFTVAYVKDLLESLGEGKVVVYSDHREAAHTIARALGVNAITGEMPPSKRQLWADAFQTDPKVRVLVATIGSFSTGVTLTASSNMVFNDLNWTCGLNLQAEARISRIGQTQICIYHRIFGSFTDQFINSKLESKQETIKNVT